MGLQHNHRETGVHYRSQKNCMYGASGVGSFTVTWRYSYSHFCLCSVNKKYFSCQQLTDATWWFAVPKCCKNALTLLHLAAGVSEDMWSHKLKKVGDTESKQRSGHKVMWGQSPASSAARPARLWGLTSQFESFSWSSSCSVCNGDAPTCETNAYSYRFPTFSFPSQFQVLHSHTFALFNDISFFTPIELNATIGSTACQ